MTDFYQKKNDEDDDNDDENDYEDDNYPSDTEGQIKKSEEASAKKIANLNQRDKMQKSLDNLSRDFVVHNNSKKDQKDKRSKFQYTQGLSVKSFFTEVLNGGGAMEVSQEVARYVFNTSLKHAKDTAKLAASSKSSRSLLKDTHVARCIREWARFYLENGFFKPYQHGKHTRSSIINDENVQKDLREHLRNMPKKTRHPQYIIFLV